jgi:phosphatidylinositol glycan class A protein
MICQLSQHLISAGHTVVILTHFYGGRMGVRYMTNGLKVYYLPVLPFYNKSALPTIVGSLPLLRHVILAEDVDVVHGHSAFSTLAQEAIFIGGALDVLRGRDVRRLATVFTDHSLFGFADASAVVTNTFLRFSLANADECVCVSHVGKENTVLRSSVPASRVSVIPNAVDCGLFKPDFGRPMPHETRVSL